MQGAIHFTIISSIILNMTFLNAVKSYFTKVVFTITLFCFVVNKGYSQYNTADNQFNKNRFTLIVITEAAITTIVTAGLHYLWYKNFPKSRFHFFNDNTEWLNMDKLGHVATAYNISAGQYQLMRWSGVEKNKAVVISGITALGFQSIIEILDGFSQKWGFSKGDMLANIAGTILFAGQQWLWSEQRIRLKFSYHTTIFPKYNPNELGNIFFQQWLKDYNGQTYWLSVNPSSFMSSKSAFPKWLNTSIGYGAEGMIGASANPKTINGIKIPEFKRYRQYYFSLDADLNRVGTQPGILLSFPNALKMPFPAVEYRKDTTLKIHPFYF